jgi:hypothetical protein
VLGAVFANREGDWMGWALAGLGIATLLAFGISMVLGLKKPTTGSKISWIIVYFLILMVVNLAVCAGGCAVGSNFLSQMSFR